MSETHSTGLRLATVGLVVGGLMGAAELSSVWAVSQTFHTTTELVAVRASVTRDGQPVRGLTASDFVVLDNGEPRPVESVASGSVPIDLEVLVGQSSTALLQQDNFASEIAELQTLVQDPDRLALTIVAENAVEVIPLGGTPVPPALPLRPLSGVTFDEIARALMVPVPAGRQRGVLVVGSEIARGTVNYQALLRLARSTPVRLDVALTGWVITTYGVPGTRMLRRTGRGPSLDYDDRMASLHWTWSRLGNDAFQKYLELHLREMAELAQSTGGGDLSWRRGSLRSAVTQALGQLREGYLLYFRPSASAARGWHPIEVRLPNHRGARVSARAGYVR